MYPVKSSSCGAFTEGATTEGATTEGATTEGMGHSEI